MEKINLNVARNGNDSIMSTFAFMKQEFVPFGKSLLVFVLPLIALDFCVRPFVTDSVFGIRSSDFLEQMEDSLVEVLAASIVYLWIQFVIANYMKVYRSKFRNNDPSPITLSEIWKGMGSRFLPFLGMNILAFLGTAVGMLLFFIPGIYLSVSWAFISYCFVLKETSIGKSFEGSMGLVKGRWWNVCLYLLLSYLIMGMLGAVFYVPYFVVEILRTVTGEILVYGNAAVYYLMQLGQYLVMTLFFVGIGVRFCSYWEKEGHETLLDKIGKMGQDLSEKQTEDEGER